MAPPAANILRQEAEQLLPFEPFEQQQLLLYALSAFVCDALPSDIFLLNGYAGTGKTSIIGAMLTALKRHRVKTVLLAPTGRAAKVASQMSEVRAQTIHRRIYRPDMSDGSMKYVLRANNDKDTVFVVDEASMITDNAGSSLLRDLLLHVYSAPGCHIIFSGDIAQLPPVGQSDSPAMNNDRLRELGLNPIRFELKEVARHAAKSGILYNASLVRHLLANPKFRPTLHTSGFTDIEAISSLDLAERISDSWSAVGREETIIITRSNKRANAYNAELRRRVLYSEEPLERGERIVISKNNYFWTRGDNDFPFIANGETAEVVWIGAVQKAYGRSFSDVELRFPLQDKIVGAKLMLESLQSEGPSIPAEEMNRFYIEVLAEQEGEMSKRLDALSKDPFYNALQAKYAYCVTCHKAQGGQWKHVYIDLGSISPDDMNGDFYRWLYTALTRATEKVFLINPTLRIV